MAFRWGQNIQIAKCYSKSQKISRDVQNMMAKIITYRSRPEKKKIFTSSSSLFDEIIDNEIFDGKINSMSKIFDDVTN